MGRRYPLLILLTLLTVGALLYTDIMAFNRYTLPFDISVTDAHTATISPITGIPLPPALHKGDRIDLSVLSTPARVAINVMSNAEGNLKPNKTYVLVIDRDGALITVPVSTLTYSALGFKKWWSWAACIYGMLLAGISLLLIWRGRDRAAVAMLIWVMSVLLGGTCIAVPGYGTAGFAYMLAGIFFFLMGRVGFYFTVEFMLGASLSTTRRMLFRSLFLVILAAGSLQQLGGSIIFLANGWAELVRPRYGMIFTAGYLVPLIILFVSYHAVEAAQRNRLRWLLWGGVLWVVGIFLSNTPVFNVDASYLLSNSCYAAAMAVFLYAILRHRVVDVSFVISRTLVYTATMSVIIGLFAAMNSFVEHATLGRDASLLLELMVPLLLGISFNTLRTRIDGYVSRFLFHRQYKATEALSDFAQSCKFIDKPERLLDLTAEEIYRQSGAQGVAIYEQVGDDYLRVRHQGSLGFPQQVEMDDAAFVQLRAGKRELDLHARISALGKEGYVYPLSLRNTVIGAVVCGPRLGEVYTADERRLFANVAYQVGVALHVLRMENKAKLVDALANGALPVSPEVQAKARELAYISG
jgi:hypothetical protein